MSRFQLNYGTFEDYALEHLWVEDKSRTLCGKTPEARRRNKFMKICEDCLELAIPRKILPSPEVVHYPHPRDGFPVCFLVYLKPECRKEVYRACGDQDKVTCKECKTVLKGNSSD